MGLRDFLFGKPRRGKDPARVERTDLLTQPAFWANHYAPLLGTEDEEFTEFVEPIFGVSADTAWAYYKEQLLNPRLPWPYLRVPLPEGFAAEVELADEPNHETRFAVEHPDWPTRVVLGYESGHAALPALRWREVVRIASCAGPVPGIENPRAAALLLFLPGASVTDDDDPGEVRAALLRAWRDASAARPGHLGELADQVVANITSSARWRRDPVLGWVNDRDISLRNPQTRMCSFDAERFRRVRQFTEMRESRGPEDA